MRVLVGTGRAQVVRKIFGAIAEKLLIQVGIETLNTESIDFVRPCHIRRISALPRRTKLIFFPSSSNSHERAHCSKRTNVTLKATQPAGATG
jgi:hypothetical protein